MKTSCLAIVTARGGSKGVPDKNIRPLAGRPLIDYSIKAGLQCPYITRTVISTDSPAIRDVAVQCGAEGPFLRPPELATDTARQEDAILHAMDWYEKQGHHFDLVCLLEPTSPLRTVETLNRGFELLASRPDAEAVFSVTECDFSPVFCSPLKPDGFMKDWMDEKYKWLQRQEIPTFYRVAGLVTISRWEAFRRNQSFMHDRTLSLVVDGVEARDIDEPVDFFIVEALAQQGFRHTRELHEYVRRPWSGGGGA